jgi:glycosyltransferase involved in cell wall biosynthesis
MGVLRNVPVFEGVYKVKTRTELQLPEDKKIVILQGSGINIDRGAEEAVEAMKEVSDAVLLILGSGDVIGELKRYVNENELNEKVIFKDRMPYQQMIAHTRISDLGLTLDKDTNINYRYSLPNKLFDYIHAGIPTLGSDLKEVTSIIRQYDVGDVISEVEPQLLAKKITEMLSSEKLEVWKKNCLLAREELNWNKESEVLKKMVFSVDG